MIITRDRTVKGVTSAETQRSTSFTDPAVTLLASARQHWGIENGLHEMLDVAFNDDRSQTRKDHAAYNQTTLRLFVFNLFRAEKVKVSIKRRRPKAAWNMDYIMQLMLRAAHPCHSASNAIALAGGTGDGRSGRSRPGLRRLLSLPCCH